MKKTLLILSAMLGLCSIHSNAQQVPAVKTSVSSGTETTEKLLRINFSFMI